LDEALEVGDGLLRVDKQRKRFDIFAVRITIVRRGKTIFNIRDGVVNNLPLVMAPALL
jgi:hypothetical protein